MRKLSYITGEKTYTVLYIVFLLKTSEGKTRYIRRISSIEEKDKDKQKTSTDIIQEIEEHL